MNNWFLNIIFESWFMMEAAGPYIIFGFIAAGLIHTLVPSEKIVALLGKRNWKSVLTASICGIPLPLCSCSVLPTAAAIRQKGASRGATTSFLISTPETGVDSIAMTYGMMDIFMTILRPLTGFITALFAGICVNLWGDADEPEPEEVKTSCPKCADSSSPANTVRTNTRSWWIKTLRYAFIDLAGDLAYWLTIGFILSGVIAACMPDWIFQGWAGQGFSSLLVMLAISMPMYICASGSTPIAAAMIVKGLSPGAALVFLLAGPATNIGSVPVLLKILGRRSTFFYLFSIVVVSLFMGQAVNMFYQNHELIPIMAISEHGAEGVSIIGLVSGVLLLLMMLNGMRRRSAPTEWRQAGEYIAAKTGFKITWNKILAALAILFVISLLQTSLKGSSQNQATIASNDDAMNIFVSITPQAYMVQRIGGEFVDPSVMVGPGQSPATYEPMPKQIAKLSLAKLYFRIGVPFENAWMHRIEKTNPTMKIIDLRKNVPLLKMKAHSHGEDEHDEDNDHGVEHEHEDDDQDEHHEADDHDADHEDDSGEVYDPHIWLSPARVKIVAQTICQTLVEAMPEHEAFFQDNLDEFYKELDLLDTEIKQSLKNLSSRNMLVFHPSWGYYADDYGLNQIAVEIEGKEPTAKNMSELIDFVKKEKVNTIFIQPQFDKSIANTIADSINGTIVTLDPLAPDYLKSMRIITGKIQKALQ